MERFLADHDFFDLMKSVCKDEFVRHQLETTYPFLQIGHPVLDVLGQLFQKIIRHDYGKQALVISLGESPSKMMFAQSFMKSFRKRDLDMFYLPVSKTVRHLFPLEEFYSQAERFGTEHPKNDMWFLFFQQFTKDPTFAQRYATFLKERGLYEELYNKLRNAKTIVFLDFLVYGNSFLGFFLFLFIPLIQDIMQLPLPEGLRAVFVVSPENREQRLADPLSFLLQSEYFDQYQTYFLRDIVQSPKLAQKVADFFMDHPQRIIQQIQAPDYKMPLDFPDKDEYMMDIAYFVALLIASSTKKYFLFNISAKDCRD